MVLVMLQWQYLDGLNLLIQVSGSSRKAFVAQNFGRLNLHVIQRTLNTFRCIHQLVQDYSEALSR
jgi:hypothetical protein